MAGHAVHDSGLDPDMGLSKRVPAEVVAVAAECRDRLRIQRGLLRKMRQMAFQAITRGRGMGPARLHIGFDGLMADEAQIGALRQKKLGQLRLVRAVALRALTLSHRSMFALPARHAFAKSRVTLETKRALLFHDHPAEITGVGIVAGKALLVNERRMVCTSNHLFQERAVTLRA